MKDSDVMPANITYFTHFSGNFWWTRAEYWHSLAPTIGPDYYDPERFLFTGKPRVACVYYTGFQVTPSKSDTAALHRTVHSKLQRERLGAWSGKATKRMHDEG